MKTFNEVIRSHRNIFQIPTNLAEGLADFLDLIIANRPIDWVGIREIFKRFIGDYISQYHEDLQIPGG